MEINIIIVHLSAAFLKLYVESSNSGSGNAKRSTIFDIIHRFILLLAWDMPEIGFVGTVVSRRFHRCVIVLSLRAGCTLQLGSGNLAAR